MISDDERRDVARKLRKCTPPTSYRQSQGGGWAHLCDMALAVGFKREDNPTAWEFAQRLADLIEPRVGRDAERTCRVESSHEVEGDGCYAYFKYELTCGHEIAWGDQLPPSYCPECGRRVLYDSDDYI